MNCIWRMTSPVYCSIPSISKETTLSRKHKTGENRVLAVTNTLTLLVSVISLAMYGVFLSDVPPGSSLNHTSCVPCNQSTEFFTLPKTNHSWANQLNRQDGNKGLILCFSLELPVDAALMKLVAETKAVVPHTQNTLSDVINTTLTPASAHKRLLPPEVWTNLTVPKFDSNKLVTTHFTLTNDDALDYANGVDILEDGLRVVQSGQYFIYSSIHFRPDSVSPCKDFLFQTWGHYLERSSSRDPRSFGCLLKTVHTCCPDCREEDQTSYLGGMFQLKEGDIIRISISAHALVYFQKQTSFVGLVQIQGGFG